ncbi:BrnA antitoxin family protein [Jannaschia sp.]|nr:BrnA antitoxin family protein [Jannaschia sp.]
MGKLTKQDAVARDYAAIVANFDLEMVAELAKEGAVPDAWHDVWRGRGAKTEKVCFRVDADVARFFRGMGPGYGPRMAAVLRGFVLARMAGFVEGARLPEQMRAGWAEKQGSPEVKLPLETVEGLIAAMTGLMGETGSGE